MSDILKTQRSFARKAEAHPDHRFDDLYHLIYRWDWLETALQHVLSNKGARTPGVDGITKDDLQTPEQQREFLELLQQELKTGTYRPLPVDRVWIPKANKHELRGLGIPCLRDRVVQEMLRMMMEPIWESDFLDCSCGFRPGRRTMDAIWCCQRRIHTQNRYFWVIEGDIRKCFDRINHTILLNLIRKRIVDHRIVNLIAAFLKAGVLENGLFATTKEGTPQGGIVSPLLANIYLHAFDVWWWEKYGSLDANAKRRRRSHQQGNAILVRYADDFIMLWNGTHEGAKQLRDEIKAFLWDTLQLELAEEKTHITHVMDGFDFLGFHVQLYPQKGKRPLLLVKPTDANIQRFKTKIKNLLREQTALMPTDVKFQQLNRVIRGWGNYYRHVNLTTTAKKVDWWLNERVLIWLKDKHKGVGVRRILQQYKVREKKGQNERYNFASQDDKGKIVHIALLADIRITKYYWKRQPNPYLSTENILQQPEMETPFAEVKDMQFDGDNARLQKQRRRALKRDNYRCQICHRTWDETSIHVHHLIPRHEGGQDTLDNLMTLCEDCHISTPTFGRKPQANREESSSESRMR